MSQRAGRTAIDGTTQPPLLQQIRPKHREHHLNRRAGRRCGYLAL